MVDATAAAAAAAIAAELTGADEGEDGEELQQPQEIRRRGRQQEVQEFIDPLAQETKRTLLLECVERQLKGQHHVSRLFVTFSITDANQAPLEQDFGDWRGKQERQMTGSLSGLLLFIGQTGVAFMEGPTEFLFAALIFFHERATEPRPVPGRGSPQLSTGVGAAGVNIAGRASPAPATHTVPAPTRKDLIGPLRILYFTELHGVRVSTSWCTYAQTAKPQSTGQVDESNAHELAFASYRKLLLACLKVSEKLSGEDPRADILQDAYRKHAELLPTIDEVMTLASKAAADYFFTYPEFHKVFIAPFHLVLHSELLWPTSPSLVY